MDSEVDLGEFEEVYQNDETGAPAIHPGMLLKIVPFAYSRGIISSRRIALACEENVLFMALSGDSRPHFTTIANFISSMGGKAVKGNVTDNESAKTPSNHGVMQGYTGIATVDAKHQVFVDAQAFSVAPR